MQATYDGGHLTKVAADNDDSLSFTYNDAGRLIQQTDQAGRTVSFIYDTDNQHLTSVTTPDGTTEYAYVTEPGAALHQVSSITLADGTIQHFEYNAHGQLIKESVNNGAETLTYSYVGVNEVIATDATGTSAHLWLNENGQIAQIEDALGHVSQLRYDANGNLTGIANADGTATGIEYDAAGNPLSVQDALGHTVGFAYEKQFGQLAEVTDQRGNAIDYGYDSHGNLNKITYADGSSETYSYNADGDLNVALNRRGESVTYTFDDKGHVTQKSYADGSTATYTYDSHGNLTSAIDADSSSSFQYDAADRLIKVTDGDGRWLSYTYDDAGRRTEMADQAGHVTHYSYDNLGHLSQLIDGTGNLIAAYSYDAAGRLSRGENGNGTYTTYQYDLAGQLTHLVNFRADGTVNSRFDYTYDEMGRRTDVATLDGTNHYTYDAIGQLTGVTLPDGHHIEYHYDAAGNRTVVDDGGTTTNYATNALNQYTNSGTVTFSYDADGNMTGKTDHGITTTYGYDAENHLVSVVNPTDTWSYEYDALGNRIASVHNGERIEYQLDPTGMVNVAGEYNSAGDEVAQYTYGIGLESQTLSGSNYYYDFNAIGSTAGLTGSTGAYVNQYSYLPFGENIVTSETVANSFEYVGQWGVMDAGNGLDFMRARYYSETDGRFVSVDPLKQPWLNTYSYAVNNPVVYFDPRGLWTGSIGWAFTGGDGLNGGTGQVNLVWDGSSWSPRVQMTVGAGYGGGIGGSGSIVATFTNAPNSGYLTGGGYEVGASDGLGVEYVGGNEYVGSNKYEGFNVSIGTPGIMPEAHIFQNYTQDLGSLTDILFGQISYPVIKLTYIPYDIGLDDPQMMLNVDVDFVKILAPKDPNDIVGPQGFGYEHWISSKNPLSYTIHYENLATATAPAQQVTITQTLDSDLNLNSFRLGDFGWGDISITVPDNSSFYINRIDLRSTKGYMVDVVAGVDVANHQAYWSFTTIDPKTGEIPEDPTIGFLPPDVDGMVGQAYANYTINANADAPTGTVIDAKATIIFTTQEPIDTPAISNTLDAQVPESHVEAVANATVESAQFLVRWSGSDVGSAIAGYTVYVSGNGGTYLPWLENTTLIEATYAGLPGHSYAFYTVASDNAGNKEAAPEQADLTIQVASSAAPTDIVLPCITAVALSTDGIYAAGHSLDFSVRFSESLFVDIAALPPVIHMTIGGRAIEATYQSGSGTDTLIFRHIIADGESNTDGTALGSAMLLNGATLRDVAGNPLVDLTLAAGITINNAPIVQTALVDQSAIEDHPFSFQVPSDAFTDVDPGDTLSYSAMLANGNPLPGWLSFDNATRTFSGVPVNENVGAISLKVIATDSSSASASDIFDLTVVNVVNDLKGEVLFWKTGAPITGVMSTLVSASADAGTQLVEFRNIQASADGSRTIEIWETSPKSNNESVKLEFSLSAGSAATWQDASGLPSGWKLLGNSDKPGHFMLSGMSITPLSVGPVKLGTLTLTAPANPQHFDLSLSAGQLGNDTVSPFSITSDRMITGMDALYQHPDMADGTYALTSAKVSGSAESNAVNVLDALAALKIAVGLNPNTDGSAVSPYQYLAADVNKDGQIKAADALNILKMAVKLSTAPAREWLFVPESIGSETMSRTNVIWPDNPVPITLDTDQELNLIGIVTGDVNGSWLV